MKKRFYTAEIARDNFTIITIDDVIELFKELTNGSYSSLFDHPQMSYYRHLYITFGTKTLLECFYCEDYNVETKQHTGFDLSKMTDKFKVEWNQCNEWLKLGPHSWAWNVRYMNGQSGTGGGYDFSRNAFNDFMEIKKEVIRFAGNNTWFSELITTHFGSLRPSEAKELYEKEGVRLLGVYPRELFMGGNHYEDTSYLDKEEVAILLKYGYVRSVRDEIDIIHCLRDFAFERIGESWFGMAGTGKTVIEHLDNYNERGMEFMHPETHEKQIFQDKGLSTAHKFSTKHGILDYCSWCYNRSYKYDFPRRSMFRVKEINVQE